RTIQYRTEGGTFAIDACEFPTPQKNSYGPMPLLAMPPPAGAFGHLAVDSTPVLRFRDDWKYHLLRTNVGIRISKPGISLFPRLWCPASSRRRYSEALP